MTAITWFLGTSREYSASPGTAQLHFHSNFLHHEREGKGHRMVFSPPLLPALTQSTWQNISRHPAKQADPDG
jgi:hypothetical protein